MARLTNTANYGGNRLPSFSFHQQGIRFQKTLLDAFDQMRSLLLERFKLLVQLFHLLLHRNGHLFRLSSGLLPLFLS